MVDSIELTPKFTQFLAKRTGHPLAAVGSGSQMLTQSDEPSIKKVITPPDWVGWLLVSVGSVLVLHSWGLKKPDS